MKYLRLKKNGDFLKLFKKGKRVFSPCLTVIYTPSKKPFMGISLSKKHGKAVKRNRIKRLIRASYSNNFEKMKGCYSMVIMPKVLEEYNYKDIEESILSCFRRMEK